MSIPRTCSGHLYEVLEVERGAPLEVIRRQYKKLALQYHPDRNNGTTHEKFQEIEEAHRVLSDNEKRKLYDLIGRENMKSIGDNPIVNMMLTNSNALLALLGSVVVMTGLLFFGLLLAFWRFDRQFAVANHGRPESFSWWWVSLFFWPQVIFVGLVGLVYIHATVTQEFRFWKVLPALPLMIMPMVLWGVVVTLNGTISANAAASGLIFVVILYMVCCWAPRCFDKRAWEEETEGEVGPSLISVRLFTLFRFVLWGIFLYLVLIRVKELHSDGTEKAYNNRSSKGISMGFVFLPLLVDSLVCICHRGFAIELDRFILFALWAQKLNVEFNGHHGYEPYALTASFTIFFYVTVAFTLSFVVFCGVLVKRTVVFSRERNDPMSQPLL